LQDKMHGSFVSDRRKRAGSSALSVWLQKNAVIDGRERLPEIYQKGRRKIVHREARYER
jgi:hypothetical protein